MLVSKMAVPAIKRPEMMILTSFPMGAGQKKTVFSAWTVERELSQLAADGITRDGRESF
jgi:hypothetical protein